MPVMPKMEEKRYKSRLPEEQREADLSRKDKEKKGLAALGDQKAG